MGPQLTERLEKNVISVGDILRIRTCAELAERLQNKSGFRRVRDAILRDPKPSLYEPRGPWFQLLVGQILDFAGLRIAFEEKDQGIPRDILLLDEKIIVECKYFDTFEAGTREADTLHQYFDNGTVEEEDPNLPPEFTRGLRPYPAPFWLLPMTVRTNHYKRLLCNGVDEKHSKLIEERCNLFAFNIEHLSSTPALLRSSLEKLASDYPRFSGFMVVEQLGIDVEHYKSKRLPTRVDIIRNPFAQAALPDDFEAAILQWNVSSRG